MLTSAHLARLLELDKKASAALEAAEATATDTGMMDWDRSVEWNNLAALETHRRAYASNRARFTELLEAPSYATDDQVERLASAYEADADTSAIAAASKSTSLTGAVAGTFRDTARQIVNPAEWPTWLKSIAGLAVGVAFLVLILPVVLGAVLRERRS